MDSRQGLDNFAKTLSAVSDVTEILLIGKRSTYEQIARFLKDENPFELTYVERIESAINLLLMNSYPIVVLDQQDKNMDIISVSTTVRMYHTLARIVLVSPIFRMTEFSSMINNSAIDAVLLCPLDFENVFKVISAQEAKYAINRALTNFISQPPKLSKASFLLLDPSLSFGDEKQPLNFVGVMITSQTVPRFTVFFEETLSQDEFLLMGYLSSITALGDELLKSKETLKEINFGGISVIFRFHGSIQISFLVRNLSRHNYAKAEERIDQIATKVIDLFGSAINSGDLSRDQTAKLEIMFHKFDQVDSVELAIYQGIMASKSLKEFGHQIVVIYSIDDLLRTELATMLLQERDLLIKEDPNLSFDVQAVSTEEDVVELVKFENCGVVIIDNMKDNQVDPLRLAELVKDFAPAIQTLLLTRNDKMDDMLIDSLNNDFIDYLTPVDAEYGQILTWTLKGLEVSANIKRTTSTGEISAAGTDGSAIAKSLLRENLGSFVSEIKPELFGLLITQNLEIIYDRFFDAPGVKLNFDKHMLAALVTSLKDVGGEIFMEEESISTFEIGGADLVIKQKSGFLFIYFVRNLSPNTSVLVSKELDAVSSVFNEIITEAGNNLPLDLLEPIFNEIIERTRSDFTSLFAKLN